MRSYIYPSFIIEIEFFLFSHYYSQKYQEDQHLKHVHNFLPKYLVTKKTNKLNINKTDPLLYFVGCRQIGLALGPSITLFLEPLNFTMFGLPVTVNNAPGLLMASLWFIMLIVTIFFFHDLAATIVSGNQL